jgi:hypothetical protein
MNLAGWIIVPAFGALMLYAALLPATPHPGAVPGHVPRQQSLAQYCLGLAALLGGCGLAGACAVACFAAGPIGWLCGLFLVPLAFSLGMLAGGVVLVLVVPAGAIWLISAAAGGGLHW